MQKGVATFTLDYGKCPPWLFERMVKLGRALVEVMVKEYGPDEFIKRISDPVWFQSLGTVLAFDWNASGLTTTLTAALKEAIRGQERDLGIAICGGKGKTSLKTPEQIREWGARFRLETSTTQRLVYNSRMSAKVDSSLVQDGFQIYHHAFFFSRNGVWSVVQQGMNTRNQTARRYHWFSEDIEDLVIEPHAGIASQVKLTSSLNLSAKESQKTQIMSTGLVKEGFTQVLKDLELLDKYTTSLSSMVRARRGNDQLTFLTLFDEDFSDHPVAKENFSRSKYLQKILHQLCEKSPGTYEELLATPGVGPKTVRALALVAEVLYGATPSYQDPARYSFAHGGKDAIPFPIDKKVYDRTITIMQSLVQKAKLPVLDKDKALGRLNKYWQDTIGDDESIPPF